MSVASKSTPGQKEPANNNNNNSASAAAASVRSHEQTPAGAAESAVETAKQITAPTIRIIGPYLSIMSEAGADTLSWRY